MLSGDTIGAEEQLALMLIGIEQVAQDNGSWDIGYLVTSFDLRRTLRIRSSRVARQVQTHGFVRSGG